MTTTNKPTFKPCPEGPPPSQRAGKYTELYAWLDANPGEWAIIEDQNTSTIVSKWKAIGYEARSVLREGNRYDLYVRKPVTP